MEILRAIEILVPLIEDVVNALRSNQMPDFVRTLPEPSRARVALNARKALLK